jgi:hypothetical protein
VRPYAAAATRLTTLHSVMTSNSTLEASSARPSSSGSVGGVTAAPLHRKRRAGGGWGVTGTPRGVPHMRVGWAAITRSHAVHRKGRAGLVAGRLQSVPQAQRHTRTHTGAEPLSLATPTPNCGCAAASERCGEEPRTGAAGGTKCWPLPYLSVLVPLSTCRQGGASLRSSSPLWSL